MNNKIIHITKRIVNRSKETRESYVKLMKSLSKKGVSRSGLSCGNLAHAIAACSESDKINLMAEQKANIGIISSYNDMLSAHKPYETYPEQINTDAKEFNGDLCNWDVSNVTNMYAMFFNAEEFN